MMKRFGIFIVILSFVLNCFSQNIAFGALISEEVAFSDDFQSDTLGAAPAKKDVNGAAIWASTYIGGAGDSVSVVADSGSQVVQVKNSSKLNTALNSRVINTFVGDCANISMRMKIASGLTRGIIYLESTGKTLKFIEIKAGVLYCLGESGTAAGVKISNINSDEWYDITITANMKDQFFDMIMVGATSGQKIVLRNQSWKGLAYTTVGAYYLRFLTNNGSMFIDNVTLSKSPAYVTELNTDFKDEFTYETVGQRPAGQYPKGFVNWESFEGNAALGDYVNATTDGALNILKIHNQSTTTNTAIVSRNLSVSDKVTYSFRIKSSTNLARAVLCIENLTQGKNLKFIELRSGSVYCLGKDGSNYGTKFGTIKYEKWYDVTITANMSDKYFNIVMTGEDGDKIEGYGKSWAGLAWVDGISDYHLRFLTNNGDLSVDSVKVSQVSLTFGNVVKAFPGGRTKALTFSYDDGRANDRELVRIFDKYKMKATFNLNSGKFGLDGYVTRDEVRELYKNHEIASHTKDHPHLQNITDIAYLREQIIGDQQELERISGKEVKGFVLPYGEPSASNVAMPLVMQLMTEGQFTYIRPVIYDTSYAIPTDLYNWKVTAHHNQAIQDKGKAFLELPDSQQSLFYIWGHSYELDTPAKWTMIDDFCLYMSGRDNVWYATNIEIAEYLKEQTKLITTASATSVTLTNNSTITLWARVDDRIVSIPASGAVTVPIGVQKIACVGDSITAQTPDGYVSRLQNMLGSKYEVKNFGVSGATLVKNGTDTAGAVKGYIKLSAYTGSIAYNPDKVIIMLGTNDSKALNWNAYKASFKQDYIDLINSYKALPSKPTIYINLSPKCYGTNVYGIIPENLENEILPLTREVAAETGCQLIDVYSATLNMSASFTDLVHPSDGIARGAIAKAVYDNITPKAQFTDKYSMNSGVNLYVDSAISTKLKVGNVSAKVSIYNKGADSTKVNAMMVIYEGNKLLGVSLSPQTIIDAKQSSTLETTGINFLPVGDISNYSVKVFLWDNDLKPFGSLYSTDM